MSKKELKKVTIEKNGHLTSVASHVLTDHFLHAFINALKMAADAGSFLAVIHSGCH